MNQASARRLHMGCGESLQRRPSLPASSGKAKGAHPGPAKPRQPVTRTGGSAR